LNFKFLSKQTSYRNGFLVDFDVAPFLINSQRTFRKDRAQLASFVLLAFPFPDPYYLVFPITHSFVPRVPLSRVAMQAKTSALLLASCLLIFDMLRFLLV
jgi:hypothetical protein